MGRINRLAAEAVRLWPSLPFMALGLWQAWSSLTYSGFIWLSTGETTGKSISNLYNISTIACGATFVLVGMLAWCKKTEFWKNSTVFIGGAIASIGSLLIILVGPYYFPNLIDSVLIRKTLFYFAAVATGCGTGIIGLQCAILYGSLSLRRILINTALSQFVTAFVYFCAYACPNWAPVEGGPSLAGIVFFSVLPLLAAYCANLGFNARSNVAQSSKEASHDLLVKSKTGTAKRLPNSFRRFSLFVFAVGIFSSLPRSTSVTAVALSQTIDENNLQMIMRIAVSIALLIYAFGTSVQRLKIGKICSLLLIFSIITMMCAVLVESQIGKWSLLVYFANNVFTTLLWCLLAFIVVQKQVSALMVFGIGRGLSILGSGLGWIFGSKLLPLMFEEGQATVFFIALAGIMLLLVLGLFSERNYEQLFSPVSEEELSLEDLFDLDRRQRELESGPKTEKRGRFSRAIEAVSQEYALSARESEVLRCLAMGYGSDRIADTMQVKVNTVRAHTHNVYVKLDVHSREELMRLVDDAVAKQ